MIKVSADTIAMLRNISTAAITGYLLKVHGLRMRAIANIRPIDRTNCRFVGPAFTLRYVPQREDLNASTDTGSPDSVMVKAMEQIPAGAVFVMDMQRDASVGGLGDVLTTRLLKAGVAGIVADGGMRDVQGIRDLGMPTFCAGPAAPASPSALMVIGLQEVIGCGGVVVFPGDIMVADEDGVAVVPAHLAEQVATAGVEKERMDGWIQARVAEGEGIRGLYPPNAANLQRYKDWVAKQ